MRTCVPNARAARLRCAPRTGRLVSAGYVEGTDGYGCPKGSARIETEPACKQAAAALGNTFGGSLEEKAQGIPRGCFLDTNDNDTIFFGTFENGSDGDMFTPLICIGAPPFPDSPTATFRGSAACAYRAPLNHSSCSPLKYRSTGIRLR
jgi:hypothetical protein